MCQWHTAQVSHYEGLDVLHVWLNIWKLDELRLDFQVLAMRHNGAISGPLHGGLLASRPWGDQENVCSLCAYSPSIARPFEPKWLTTYHSSI